MTKLDEGEITRDDWTMRPFDRDCPQRRPLVAHYRPKKTMDEGVLLLRMSEVEETLRHQAELIDSLKSEQVELRSLIANSPYTIFIQCLGSHDVSVLKPFPLVIHNEGEDVVATWVEANISAVGPSQVSAVHSLMEQVAIIFVDLEKHTDDTLGRSMRLQKRVLQESLCLRS